MNDIKFDGVPTIPGRFASFDGDSVTLVPADQFYERTILAVITHEGLHRVLKKTVGFGASAALDNLTPSMMDSTFWIECNWTPKWWKERFS